MPRPRNLTPTYTLHKQSGRGRLIWTDTAGVRHEKLLPGEYGSDESLAAKARLELELATSPTATPWRRATSPWLNSSPHTWLSRHATTSMPKASRRRNRRT
jgi:hypothetical protein